MDMEPNKGVQEETLCKCVFACFLWGSTQPCSRIAFRVFEQPILPQHWEPITLWLIPDMSEVHTLAMSSAKTQGPHLVVLLPGVLRVVTPM